MPTEPSKYAGNQFDTVTESSLTLMGEILSDTVPKITAATIAHPVLTTARDEIITADSFWTAAETALANAEAALTSATAAFEDKLASMTRKPSLDENSPIETWDSTIRTQVAYNGTTYLYLLPQGRETLTVGDYEHRVVALGAFAVRLSEQVLKPVLIALGVTVTAFHTALNGFRNTQATQKTAITTARTSLKDLRITAAQALYGMVGDGIRVFQTEPWKVDTLFDVNLLRSPAQAVPAEPEQPTWAPATRTVAVTVMPAGATRLEVWREGPGGMPELLLTGERDALSVVIPANITFDPGDTYQLWMQGRNSKGTSLPSPKVTWVAA